MFNIDICTPLTIEQQNKVIDSIAEKIVGRHLETPAVLFLDMHKPLSFIASQSMLAAMPFLAPIFGAQSIADLSKVFQNRENIEVLITRIEEMSARSALRQAQDALVCHPELDSGPTDAESSSA